MHSLTNPHQPLTLSERLNGLSTGQSAILRPFEAVVAEDAAAEEDVKADDEDPLLQIQKDEEMAHAMQREEDEQFARSLFA